tara:strand:- start:88 stop:258 length:171 start_codon:yes stop_codon:yes gene_type:complete
MIEKMKRNNPKQQACNYSMPTVYGMIAGKKHKPKLWGYHNPKAAKIIYPVHHIKPD